MPHALYRRITKYGKTSMRPVIALLFAASLALLAPDVQAAQTVRTLPPVKSFVSARFEVAPMVVNGLPEMVGKGEIESPARAHLVLKTLPLNGQAEKTVEMVLYDGTTYVREDTNAQWYIDKQEVCCVPAADQSLEHGIEPFGTLAAITKIGSAAISGAPTDQYQVWFGRAASDPPGLDHITIDFWIGQQINYMYQVQVSFYGADPKRGPTKGEFVQRFYDQDAANIVIRPPAGAKPRSAAGARSLSHALTNNLLRTLVVPLNLRALHERAVDGLRK